MSNQFAKSLFVAVIAIFVNQIPVRGDERPNILWITAEDMSPTLGCYGDDYAITPNIDRLAGQSVRYTLAFATAPVCSPSRSCLITGCYAPSLGTHNMRSAFPIPAYMKGFPALLRERGYYTTNNAKTDYNTANWQEIVSASWDACSNTAHWRGRQNKDQPFFSVFNLMTSHQSRSMVWPREQFVEEVQSRLEPDEIHDPAEAPLPPYYPDTPVIRRTVARYYDCVTAMDKEVAAILAQLEEDGLADDTIVFFYSDHGSGMPRHKRALLDSGMHVPLLIRFPEKYRHLAAAKPGQTIDRLVSFVDFGPTVLSLAGAAVPEYMQGNPFLGRDQADLRQYVYGHRDRIDEVLDCARSVRDKRYLYIRNYMPHLGYHQPSAWPDQGEIRHEIYRLTDRQTMTGAQWHYAAPTRPVEELYDCATDLLNVHNLAESAEHQGVVRRLREANRRHIRETRDLGFLPESEAWNVFANKTPWEGVRGREVALDVAVLFEAAEQVGVADASALLANLESSMAGVRYWGAAGLAACEPISGDARRKLAAARSDKSPAVRIEAAGALARHGQPEQAIAVLTAALEHESLTVVLHAARTTEMLQWRTYSRSNPDGSEMPPHIREAIPAMQRALARAEKIRPPNTPATVVESGDQDLAMFVGFSTGAFLSRVRAARESSQP